MELTAKVGLSWHAEPESGRPMLRVKVTNIGDAPIRRLRLVFEYEYENPQDVSSEFESQPGRLIRVEELGRQMEFLPAQRETGCVQIGESRVFFYPADSFPEMESVVASLSPERYRVVIVMDGQREVAIPGEVFGAFILEGFSPPETKDPEPEAEAEAEEAPQRRDPHAREEGSQWLPPARMKFVFRLIDHIMEQGRPFEIMPCPGDGDRDAGSCRELPGARWRLRLSDGAEETLSFAESMLLVHGLMMLRLQFDELRRNGGCPSGEEPSLMVHVDVLRAMTPGGVRPFLAGLSMGEQGGK